MAEVWPLKLALTEGRATAVAEIPAGDWINPQALVAGVVAGDILYGASATALARLPAGTPGQVLTMGVSAPSWSSASIPQPFRVASAAAMIALPASQGDIAIRTDEGKTYVLSSNSPTILSDWWEELSSGGSAVLSVNGYVGAVVLTAADVGALTTVTGDARYYTQTASDARFVKITNTGAASVSAVGNITLSADSDADTAGAVILQTAGTTKWTVTNSGVLQAGTALTTGALPGAIVLPNATSLWGANAANSAPYRLIQLDATDFVRVDVDARGTQFGGPIATGTAPLTYRNINLLATLSGNVAQVGIWCHPTADSSATTSAVGMDVRVSAAAGAYTVADVYGIHILNANIGAGATATRNTAILIDSQTAGTTNTAIQVNGSARCLFNGGVTIGVTTVQTPTLYVAQPASATTAAVWVKYGATPGAGGNGLTIVKSDSTTNVLQVTDKYSVVIGNAALATNATDGFLYFAASAGAPTGVPTAFAGRVPVEYDTTNDTLNIYNGAWKALSFTGVVDNINIAGVYFNVDSDNSDGTNADSFIWGRDRVATAGGTTLMTLNASGYLQLGTTVTTSVAAFDIVIPRGNFLRSVNNAGTDTKPLIGLDTTDTVLLGSGNVRVQSGIFLVNTAVTTAANSGDIVTAFQRGLRILNSTSATAYLAIDRTTIGTLQVLRIEASTVSVVVFGTPGYVDDAALGDIVLPVSTSVRFSNAAGTASVKVMTMTGTGDAVLNGANSLALQTAATDRLKIDAAGNVLFWAGAGLGGGALVISIHNATTDPTTNPAAGGILYASGGALKWRGSSGTVTTVAPA